MCEKERKGNFLKDLGYNNVGESVRGALMLLFKEKLMNCIVKGSWSLCSRPVPPSGPYFNLTSAGEDDYNVRNVCQK